MKAIRKRAGVTTDLVEIYVWIGERDPDAAERFLAAVDATLEQIRRQPGIGWQRPWRSRRLKAIRSWRVESFREFLVFYREEQASIEIYAVLRGARHLGRALGKRV